jgi:hypothetical protein
MTRHLKASRLALAAAMFLTGGTAQAITIVEHFNNYGTGPFDHPAYVADGVTDRRPLLDMGGAVGGWEADWGRRAGMDASSLELLRQDLLTAPTAVKEAAMARLIRMDQTGHTTLAEWTADDDAAVEAAVAAFREQLDAGYYAVVNEGEGQARQVEELPLDADLVILRRPIAGG